MKPLHHLDNVHYPLGGMGYITHDLADLFHNKIKGKREIRVYSSAQPNSHPHLGSIMTLMSVFAVGKHLEERLKLPVRMFFDQLENSPAEKKVVDGVLYSKSLKDVKKNKETISDKHMHSFRNIMNMLSERTKIPYSIRTYTDFQRHPIIRRTMIKILQNAEEFAQIVSPSTKRLHLRFPCPVCKFADKHAINLQIKNINEKQAVLKSYCPEHGEYSIIIQENNDDYFDVNAPLHEVLLGVYLVEKDKKEKSLSIMVDGGDWAGVWPLRMHQEALSFLGYNQIPQHLFTPIISDWSGAKFSKSLYVRTGAYDYLPKGLVDFSHFHSTYGEEGIDKLWVEAQEWAKNPVKFFRNYSVDYFRLILEAKGEKLEYDTNYNQSRSCLTQS